MARVESSDILDILKVYVPFGTVTTYGHLSNWAFGRSNSAQAIVAMLNAAVRADNSNSEFTNRVVKKDGTVVDVNGQLHQLIREGIRIADGKVDMDNARVIKFD
jgi:alkylated DNA nucleotide flippase Atl1